MTNTPHSSIEIGSIVSGSFQKLLQTKYTNSKIVILVDENTHDNCLEYLITSFPDELTEAEVMLLPAGEENKVMEVCFQIWEALSDYKIGRKDLIINLGGGVITDMGGFIASIYKRGVDFINIPTSYLGMVDASIGGKVGIDLGELKNQLGTFYWPVNIFIDPIFLETLPEEEKINGLAEVFKTALISNGKLWNELKEITDLKSYLKAKQIEKIVSIKKSIVKEDPFEKGIRKTLNFGHTIGHAIEGFLLFKDPIKHGYAIAIGMVLESYVATELNLMSPNDYEDIAKQIYKWFAPIKLESEEIDSLIELMRHDKKNFDGVIKMALVTTIGSSEYDISVSEDVIRKALRTLVLN